MAASWVRRGRPDVRLDERCDPIAAGGPDVGNTGGALLVGASEALRGLGEDFTAFSQHDSLP